MRVDLKKFLFVGLAKEKEHFFARAQEEGIIQFIASEPLNLGSMSPEVEVITDALKIIRGLPPAKQETLGEYILGEGLAHKIVDYHSKIERLNEELRMLKLEIARVRPFGDFSLEQIRELEKESKRHIQFFAAKPRLREEGKIPDSMVYITTDQGLDYYLSINPEPVVVKDMIEMQIDEPLGALQTRKEHIEAEINLNETRLKGYAKYNEFLHNALLFRLDRVNLHMNARFAQRSMDGDLFAVEGWTPVTKIEAMKQFVDKLHVFVEEVLIEEKDTIPTCLENRGLNRVGEDLVHIYDTPSHEDKDPSLWVLFSFALFFAMIIGDAGYGLIFLAAALFMRYKMGDRLKEGGKRLLKLLFVLSAATILWGVSTNTYFATSLAPAHSLRAYSPLTWLTVKKVEYYMKTKNKVYLQDIAKYPEDAAITDARELITHAHADSKGNMTYELADSLVGGILMELALFIGIVHIMLSMLRYIRRNWAFAGWLFVLIGSFLYFPTYLETPSFVNYVFGVSPELAAFEGIYLMVGGFFLALTLSLIQHKVMGLLEPMTAIQILADVLSYLRLYALGLAGSIVAATVNEFAVSAGLFLGVIVALIGHIINIVLSIMGGVIHGLRLNFIEWYHYSFYGGGKKFNPLRKLANMKKE